MTFRTGRQAADPVALAGAPAISNHYGAMPPSATLDRRDIDFDPLDMGNKLRPICTAENYINMARAIFKLNMPDAELAVDPAMADRFYAETIGQPDATDAELAATDGVQVLTMLAQQWFAGCDIGPQVLHGQYGTLPATRLAIAGATGRLGTAGLGIRLYDRDVQDMGTSKALDVVAGRDDGALYGRHFLFTWDYLGLADGGVWRVGTWGAWQPVTSGWIEARTDEAHAIRLRQLDRADGTGIGQGVDIAGLEAALVG